MAVIYKSTPSRGNAKVGGGLKRISKKGWKVLRFNSELDISAALSDKEHICRFQDLPTTAEDLEGVKDALRFQ